MQSIKAQIVVAMWIHAVKGVLKVTPARKEFLVPKELPDHKGLLVLQALKVQPDHKVLLVLKVQLV